MITVTRNDNSEVHSADSAHVPSTGPNGPINTLNSRGAGSETGQAIVTHANLPPGDSATISRSTIRNQPPTDALHKADPLVPGTSSRSVSTRWIVRNRSRDSTGSCHRDSRNGSCAATFCSQSLTSPTGSGMPAHCRRALYSTHGLGCPRTRDIYRTGGDVTVRWHGSPLREWR